MRKIAAEDKADLLAKLGCSYMELEEKRRSDVERLEKHLAEIDAKLQARTPSGSFVDIRNHEKALEEVVQKLSKAVATEMHHHEAAIRHEAEMRQDYDAVTAKTASLEKDLESVRFSLENALAELAHEQRREDEFGKGLRAAEGVSAAVAQIRADITGTMSKFAQELSANQQQLLTRLEKCVSDNKSAQIALTEFARRPIPAGKSHTINVLHSLHLGAVRRSASFLPDVRPRSQFARRRMVSALARPDSRAGELDDLVGRSQSIAQSDVEDLNAVNVMLDANGQEKGFSRPDASGGEASEAFYEAVGDVREYRYDDKEIDDFAKGELKLEGEKQELEQQATFEAQRPQTQNDKPQTADGNEGERQGPAEDYSEDSVEGEENPVSSAAPTPSEKHDKELLLHNTETKQAEDEVVEEEESPNDKDAESYLDVSDQLDSFRSAANAETYDG